MYLSLTLHINVYARAHKINIPIIIPSSFDSYWNPRIPPPPEASSARAQCTKTISGDLCAQFLYLAPDNLN